MAMKKKGFSNVIPLLNIFQVPILITWFLSLRYMSNLPEIYPQIYTEGFLWFEDLSTYDPYFVLPIAAACLSSLSIIYSPNLARNNITIPFMAPFVKYLKYLSHHLDFCLSDHWLSLPSFRPPSASTGPLSLLSSLEQLN